MNTLPTSMPNHPPVQDTKNILAHWIFERIRPFIAGRVLEVDDGSGRIAPLCLQQDIQVEVLPINLTNETLGTAYNGLAGEFDTVIVLHAAQLAMLHPQIISNCALLLKKEGYLAIQLPACTALYNELDQGYSKWKFYNMLFMYNILRAHFRILKIRYYLVMQNPPPPFQGASKYRERVALFTSTEATDFDQACLCAIVVGQRR